SWLCASCGHLSTVFAKAGRMGYLRVRRWAVSVLGSRFSVLGSRVQAAGLELTSLIIIIVAGFRGEDCVPGGRHGGVAFDVAPEDAIQKRGVDGVGTGEIHLCGLRSAGGFAGVHLVDEAVVAIAPLGGESRLRAGAGE